MINYFFKLSFLYYKIIQYVYILHKNIHYTEYIVTTIAIYNSKAFKRARTACSVHCVDSAHYTLYRGNLIKGGEYNGALVLSSSR